MQVTGMGIDEELDAFYRSKQKHKTAKLKRDTVFYEPDPEDLYKLTEKEEHLELCVTDDCLSQEAELSPVEKGRIGEDKATEWLEANGYWVFRNTKYSGPIDLIAVNGSETRFVDVKTCSVQRLGGHDGVRVFVANQLNKSVEKVPHVSVEILYVYKDQVSWQIGRLIPDWEGL